jgi:aminoglycoside phosphotransferase (APT) family kinase protein
MEEMPVTDKTEINSVMEGSVRNAKASFSRIDPQRLQRFIERQPGIRRVEMGAIDYLVDGAGMSNGIGLFEAVIDRGAGPRRESLVVRYAPGVMLLSQKSYADEFRTLLAATAAGLPVPTVYWLDPTGQELGSPGYVMERIVGDKPTTAMYSRGPLSQVSPEQRKEMMLQAAGFHGRLRKTAIGQDKVPHLLKRGPATARGAIERELGWWLVEARNVRPADDPKLLYVTQVHDWLVANQPVDAYEPNLVHGDAQIANLMYRNGQLAAALDWELAFLGHNESDLALLPFITEMQQSFDKPVQGTPTEAEYIARFEQESGRKVCSYDYFACFCQFKVQTVGLMTLAGVPSPEEVWSFYKQHMDRAWDRAKAARSRT